MNKRNALMIGCVLAACSGGSSGDPIQPPTTNPPGGGNTNAVQSATVSMRSDFDNTGYGTASHNFSPRAVVLARGGTVTWVNESGTVHNVVFSSGAGAPANLSDMASGAVNRTFPNAGTFGYGCTNHDNMTGTVTVQ